LQHGSSTVSDPSDVDGSVSASAPIWMLLLGVCLDGE
jgi:hypothetical protein